jgi:hypothetical protein
MQGISYYPLDIETTAGYVTDVQVHNGKMFVCGRFNSIVNPDGSRTTGFGCILQFPDLLTTTAPLLPAAANNLGIVLENDFTIEFFIAYDFIQETNTNFQQKYFESEDVALYYEGFVDFETNQNTNQLRLIIKNSEYIYDQPIRLYKNSQGYYYHYAIVRKNNIFYLWIDGIKALEFSEVLGSLIIQNLTIGGFRANLNSLRITKYARYSTNFIVPSMRFGLLGGFEGDKLLENIILNKWYNICEVEDVVAYMMFGS